MVMLYPFIPDFCKKIGFGFGTSKLIEKYEGNISDMFKDTDLMEIEYKRMINQNLVFNIQECCPDCKIC